MTSQPLISVSRLDHCGIITATGQDARSFLQGQLTNDVMALTEEQSQISALCNPKGRVLAVMRLIERADAIHLLLPRSIAPSVLSHLQRFVFRAQVELEDRTEQFAVFGVTGNSLYQVEEALAFRAPASPNVVAGTRDARLIREFGNPPRWLLLTGLADGEALLQRLGEDDAPDGARAWRHQDIVDGLPAVQTPTQEKFVAQMLNLDLLQGISFDKGCYTGQEIVARTQNLGSIKRRMLRFGAPSATAMMPGDEVYANGETAGQVVSAVPVSGGWELLAVIKLDTAGESLSVDGQALSRLSLPYAIPELRQ